jgi:hypothetical protein
MNIDIRRKLEMATRVRTFSRAHPSTEPTYTTVLGRLEDRLAEAQAIATRQHEARVAARGARNNRRELRRIVHFQLLKYLVAVGNVAAHGRTELATQFRLPSVSANNQAFLTAVKALVAAAEQQRDVLVAAGMAPALPGVAARLAEFETASEEARAKRLSHIGADRSREDHGNVDGRGAGARRDQSLAVCERSRGDGGVGSRASPASGAARR